MGYTCEVCKDRKHIRNEKGKYERCICLREEFRKKRASSLGDHYAVKDSLLEGYLDKNIRLQASVPLLKKHLASIIVKNPKLNVLARGVQTFLVDNLNSEVFMAKAMSYDLLVVTLDGVIENRYIPSLLHGVVTTRQNNDRGTWLVMSDWDVDRLIRMFDPDNKNSTDEFSYLLSSLEELSLA